MREFLENYYKPSDKYSGYYNPFRTSNPSNRWLTEKYPSGALQRITVDTFGGAIIHTKGEPFWGWENGYVDLLDNLRTETRSSRIPLFHLAVWLYRDQEFHKEVQPSDLIEKLREEFNLSDHELRLCNEDEPNRAELVDGWLDSDPITEEKLLEIIGWPPGDTQRGAVKLDRLEIRYVGPTELLRYEPSERLNIVTGDNSLGKTFLLDCVWWTISDHWGDYPAAPRANVHTSDPSIEFSVETSRSSSRTFKAQYDWDAQSWALRMAGDSLSGLAIYAKHDGSFVVWDPSRPTIPVLSNQIVMSLEELWNGKEIKDGQGQTLHICNGLIRDWVSWQTRGDRFEEIYSAFIECLEILSPSESERLVPDEPVMMPNNSREIPTLNMEYGQVPILHASAGVQRIVGLAYFVVWAWFEHKKNSELAKRVPQDGMVLVIDEIEAHLHPKWQRAIVPAINKVIDRLSDNLSVQAHIATHSPLVLASAETVFSDEIDALHHLFLEKKSVEIERVEFQKQGSADAWLMSDIFGLLHARSIAAERAIEAAKSLQLSDDPDPEEVTRVNSDLISCLRDDDEFWPRWRFFAEQYQSEE